MTGRFVGVLLMGGALVLTFSAPTSADVVTIKPIQICNDAGGGCANSGFELFEPESDKIWSQAGIDFTFLSWSQINETDFLDVSVGNGAVVDQETLDVMELGRTTINDSAVTLAINMYFVNTLDLSAGFFGLGCGAPVFATACGGGIGVFIADAVFSTDRIDTIAHEVGHVLGLTHNGFGAGGANNLMTQGSDRSIPGSINDIAPDGANLDQLTAAQITEANSSGFVTTAVPEPGTLALLPFGLVLLGARRRSR